MNCEIREEDFSILPEYVRIPATFQVKSVLDVQLLDGGLSGFVLSERRLAAPYVKDYDENESEGPLAWPRKWDLSNWGMLSAFVDGRRAGGCAIAFDTPAILKLEGRSDIAALWDLRVHPDFRRQGIGSELYEAAAAWAKQRGCCCLKAETQNNNVRACRFYVKHGCVLASMDRYAYPEYPDEIEMVWRREL